MKLYGQKLCSRLTFNQSDIRSDRKHLHCQVSSGRVKSKNRYNRFVEKATGIKQLDVFHLTYSVWISIR